MSDFITKISVLVLYDIKRTEHNKALNCLDKNLKNI